MNDAVCAEWRKTIVSTENWVQHLEVAEAGEAGGRYVRSDASGLVAYLKPLRKRASHPRAAYEKICSDLSHEIRVGVPPVVLYRRPDVSETDDAKPEGEPRCVALSLVYRKRWEWQYLFEFGDPRGGLPPQLQALEYLVKQILGSASGVVAFDTWIRNTDRNNPRNALLAFDEANVARMIFIDYANTMDHDGQWDQGQYQVFARVAMPPFFADCLRKAEVEDTAARIEGLSEQVVSDIVGRIPDDFLAGDRRAKLIDWLLWRKRQLCATFNQWYPGR
jgi:hypothetical protein